MTLLKKLLMKKPLKAMPLTDESQMPYGAHKGKKMANVPAEYLLFLYENDRSTMKSRPI